MKKSPWLAIRDTFADTPDYKRRNPVAKCSKYAPIHARPSIRTPSFPRANAQNDNPSKESSSSKTTPLSTRPPRSRFNFSSHKRGITLAEIDDSDVENCTKLHQSSTYRRKDSQTFSNICNTPEPNKDGLVIDDSSCESVTFDPDYDDYHIDTVLTAKSSSNPLKCVSRLRRTEITSKRLSLVCSISGGPSPSHKTPLLSRANNQNEPPTNDPTSSKTTPLSTRPPRSRFNFSSCNLEEIEDSDVENRSKLQKSSPARRKYSQPFLSICNTPDRLVVIDDSSCGSVTLDPDHDDHRIDSVHTTKSTSDPLKCVSRLRRTEQSSKRLASVCSNLSGRFIQHPESPVVSIVVPDSQASRRHHTTEISESGTIVVSDSQSFFKSTNTTCYPNSQLIEAFETEPSQATQRSIEFRIDEINSERDHFSQTQAASSCNEPPISWTSSSTIPCSQISTNRELYVSPRSGIESQSSGASPATVQPIGLYTNTKQKKPLRPIKGGLLEELIRSKRKAQSDYNFWHNMRRAGVAVQHTVMIVTGFELSFGRVLVYAKELEYDSQAEGSRALFTFDGTMQFCSRLASGAQFEVDLSDATGYSIKDGVVAYPGVQELWLK